MQKAKWQELEEKEYNYLDTIDIRPIISANQDLPISEIRRIIEDAYEDDYLNKNPDDDFLFNCITEGEFADYIRKKYGIKIREEVIYYFDI